MIRINKLGFFFVLSFILIFCLSSSTSSLESSSISDASNPAAPDKDTTFSKEKSEVKRVVELTSRNFDSYIADGNVWLIEFYAPWCGHCKRFAPTYEQVAIKLHTLHDSTTRKIMVGRVNGASEKALASRFSITKYPSFYLIEGWTVREYGGNRSLDSLIEFATKTFKKIEPIPFLQSPFGPIGQLKAIMMFVGSYVLQIHEAIVQRGYSNTFSAMLLGTAAIIIGIVCVITIGLMTVLKPKVD